MGNKKISQFTAGVPTTTSLIPFIASSGTETYKGTATAYKNPILNPTAKGVLFGASGVGTVAEVGTAAYNGQIAISNSALTAGAGFIDRDFTVTYLFDGAGAALTAKHGMGFRWPMAATIDGWEVYCGTTNGDGTVDIVKATYANLPVTGTPSIIGTGTKPSVAGTIKGQGTTVATWGTTTVAAGDWTEFWLTNTGTITYCAVSLYGRYTAVS